MVKNKQVLDLTEEIEELKVRINYLEKDNWTLAKEIDRLNEYVQIMELERNNKCT